MIQAKVICDSLDPRGNRLTTLEIILPRYILAELNTHRMLSKNSASSRAIPLKKMIQSVRDNGFKPYAWQKNHSGMQGTEYHTNNEKIEQIENFWEDAKQEAIISCSLLNDEDVTKQLANRLLEPFMWHKVLVSGTEWENFFNLRCPSYQLKDNEPIFESWKLLTNYYEELHHDFWTGLSLENYTILERLQKNKGQADIHMMFLAESIYDAMNESIPVKLKEGEWHIPYGDNFQENWYINYTKETEDFATSKDKLIRRISVARCARLSYQTLSDNPVVDYEADLKLYDQLANSGHYSPFEHVAKVMTEIEYKTFVKGKMPYSDQSISTPTDNMKGWCLNFKGFIQERYLLEQSWNQ